MKKTKERAETNLLQQFQICFVELLSKTQNHKIQKKNYKMFKISLLLLLVLPTTIVNANMIDVLTPYMKSPSSCKHGCADWTTYETKIWNDNRTFSISKFSSLSSFFFTH